VLDVYRRLDLRPYEISKRGAVLTPTTFEELASPTLPEGHISVDFAVCRQLPQSFLSS
jgi:hypothetical protein